MFSRIFRGKNTSRVLTDADKRKGEALFQKAVAEDLNGASKIFKCRDGIVTFISYLHTSLPVLKIYQLLETASTLGHAKATCYLAFFVLGGKPNPRDPEKAFQLYLQSAEMGYAPAMRFVAQRYLKGKEAWKANGASFSFGPERDEEKAISWFQKGVNNNDAHSCYAMADYWIGFSSNLPRPVSIAWTKRGDDKIVGLSYLIKGATNYSTNCMRLLGEIANIDPELYTPQTDIQKQWAVVAKAYDGDVTAQFQYAVMLQKGRVVPKDVKVAAFWLRKAAEQDSHDAKSMLGRLFHEGVAAAKHRGEWVYCIDSNNTARGC